MDNRPVTYAILHMYGRESQVIVRCRGANLHDDLICKAGKLEAYVITPELIEGASPSVRVRFDDSQPVRQTWGRSEDYKGLFAPNPRAFVGQLLKSKKFLIEYPPYEKTPETLDFDVSGLPHAPYSSEMDGFLRSLKREQVESICGSGNEISGSVRLNVQYPPTKGTHIGLDFEFSTSGDDAGQLISITPMGMAEKDKYKLTWYGGTIGGDALEKETALRLVSSSPALMNQWKASRSSLVNK